LRVKSEAEALFCLGGIEPAPGVERIVTLKLVFELFQILREVQTVTTGDCF